MSRERTSGVEAAADNFEAIEQAVMESGRGRWFLDEYVRRRSGGETKTLLTAIGKLETAVAANQNLVTERLGQALSLIASIDSKLPAAKSVVPHGELSPQHLKFFKQDEDLFEAPAKPARTMTLPLEPQKTAESKTEATKGAKLVIRRQPEVSSESGAESAEPTMDPAIEVAPPAPADTSKSRIVIIRHRAGETIDVPLHDDLRASA